MELVEIKGLAVEISAACIAALAQPEDIERRRVLYMTLQPLASRDFMPFSEEIQAYARGLANQSAFLADILRGHIEDCSTESKTSASLRAMKHNGENLLEVLGQIMKARGQTMANALAAPSDGLK